MSHCIKQVDSKWKYRKLFPKSAKEFCDPSPDASSGGVSSSQTKPPRRCWAPRAESLLCPQPRPVPTCSTLPCTADICSPNPPLELKYSIFWGAKSGRLVPISFPNRSWTPARAEATPAVHMAWSRKGTSPSKHPLQRIFHNSPSLQEGNSPQHWKVFLLKRTARTSSRAVFCTLSSAMHFQPSL